MSARLPQRQTLFGQALCENQDLFTELRDLDYRQAKPNQVILGLHWGATRHPRRRPTNEEDTMAKKAKKAKKTKKVKKAKKK